MPLPLVAMLISPSPNLTASPPAAACLRMVFFDHVQIWLEAGNSPCLEFVDDEGLDEDQENNALTRYAEVSSNQNWKVGIKLDEHFDWQFSQAVAARLFVDGKRITKTRLMRPKGQALRPVQTTLRGIKVGNSDECKFLRFRFADLETSKWLELARTSTDQK